MAVATDRSRRTFLRLGLGVCGLGLLSACAPQAPAATAVPASTTEPSAKAPPTSAGASTPVPATAAPAAVAKPEDEKIGRHLIGELEGPELITDSSKWPTSFKEAPTLAALVAAGTLPPVEQRLPQDPIVVKPVHEIGKYGGTWRRGFTGPADFSNGSRLSGSDRLMSWDYTGTRVVPNLVREMEISPDGKVITFHLRRGMKWSDGHPFTTDDFMFYFEDVYGNKDIEPSPFPHLVTTSGHVSIVKIDATTFRFTFQDPYYVLPAVLAGSSPLGGQAQEGVFARGGFLPAHYMKQFHPKYTPQAELEQKAQEAGMDGWVNLFKSKTNWALNPDLPVVTVWKTVTPINTPTWTLERNPYSIWVDTEGNQLPYIDRIQMQLAENLEVLNLRAIAGEYDMQERHTDMGKLPVFLENQEKGDYTVRLDSGGIGTDVLLLLNQSFEGDPEIARWFSNVEFRRALSLGIDRDQLNEAFWLGLGVPGSFAPWERSPYSPGPEWRTKWATLDVDQANQMLDQIGLDKKDAEGFRLRTDGQGQLRLLIETYLGFMPFTPICEMIRQHWRQIGIQADVRELERNLMYSRRDSNLIQIGVEVPFGTENMFSHPMTHLFPFNSISHIGPLFGTWYVSNGTKGKEPPAKIKDVMQLYREAFSANGDAHYEMGKQIWRIALDEVWGIATVGQSPGVNGVRIVKNSMGNVPARTFNGSSTLSPTQALPWTYHFK